MSIESIGYKHVPEGITNIIPHKYEIIIFVGATGFVFTSLLGTGLYITAGAIGLIIQAEEYLLMTKRNNVISKNKNICEKENLKYKKEQREIFTKISDVITNAVITGICYKVSQYAMSYFNSNCYKNDIYIQKTSCSAIFGEVVISMISLGISTGYLLKNLFK